MWDSEETKTWSKGMDGPQNDKTRSGNGKRFGEEEWYAGNEIGRSREGAEGEWKRIAVWQWQRYLSGTEGERRSTGVD
jgi:hypothetical protein